MRNANCQMRNANSELRKANCELRIANSETRNAKSELRNVNREIENAATRNAICEVSRVFQKHFHLQRKLAKRCCIKELILSNNFS